MAIRWDKFTVKAQEAVQRASELASEHGNPELLPVHLLAGLIEDKEGIVTPVLEKIGIGPQGVLTDIYGQIEKLPKVSGAAAQPAMSSQLNQLLPYRHGAHAEMNAQLRLVHPGILLTPDRQCLIHVKAPY